MAVRSDRSYSIMELDNFSDQMSPPPAEENGWEVQGSERRGRKETLVIRDHEERELGRKTRPPPVMRENSFLVGRDRSKSMEGGVLHPPLRERQHHLQHESLLKSDFLPPSNYNIFNIFDRLVTRLNKLRVKIRRKGEDTCCTAVERKAKVIVESVLFDMFLFLVVVAHALLLCFFQPELQLDSRPINDLIHKITIGFLLVYCVEALLNIMAYGLILPNKSFLRRPEFILDLLIIVFGILYLSLRYVQRAGIPILAETFSSFMMLKLIKALARFNTVRFMLKALAKSFRPLFYLFILNFLVILCFALIGIDLFLGKLHGGCYANYTTPAGIHQSILVSDFPCNNRNPEPIFGEHVCPRGSKCSFWERGPREGIVSFDNIFTAFVTVFQSITLEGWSEVFFLYESSVGSTYAWVYFFIVIFLGSVFILNLQTSVLTIVFLDVSEHEEKYGNSRHLREKKRIESDIHNYNEWIKRGAELHPGDTGSIDRFNSVSGSWASNLEKRIDSSDDEDDEKYGVKGDDKDNTKKQRCGWYYWSSKKVLKMVQSRVWFWLNIIGHMVNLVLLMSLHFPSEPNFDRAIYIINYIFSFTFTVDLLFKLYGVGPVEYFIKRRSFYQIISKIAEGVLGILSVISLAAFLAVPSVAKLELPVVINAVWSTKIVLIWKISRNKWKNAKEVLKTVGQLMRVILSLLALLGLFLLLFTIAGLRIFGNRLSINRYVQPNFDDPVNSLYLVFQLLTTEDWHNILYTSVGAYYFKSGQLLGVLTTFYFLVAIFLGGLILVSIFLALAVDKLSEVRYLEEDKTKENEDKEKERKKRTEQLSALKNPVHSRTRRRTIKQVLRFQAENPVERARAIQEEQPHWWRQISLPQLTRENVQSLDFRRSVSNPHDSVSSPSRRAGERLSMIQEEGDNAFSYAHERSVHVAKRKNPLSSVPSSGFFNSDTVKQARARENPANTAMANQITRMKDMSSGRGEGSEDGDDVFHPNVERGISTRSSLLGDDATVGIEGKKRGSLEGAGSISLHDSNRDEDSLGSQAQMTREVKSPDSVKEKRQSRFSRQSSVDEGRCSPPQQITSPSDTSLEDQPLDLSHRYTRGSSLEPIHQPFTRIIPEPIMKRRTTRDKIMEKGEKVLKGMKEYFGTIHLDPSKELERIPPHTSFFIISHESQFRKFCFELVKSLPFQTITYVVVFLSSIVLMLEIPIGVNDAGGENIRLCAIQRSIIFIDIALIVFFVVEMLLKMIALGVFLHRDSYLRGLFNILDCLVTIFNLLPLILYPTENISSDDNICISYGYDVRDTSSASVVFNTLRVIRVLRPLRAIRVRGLYLVTAGLISSIKAMVSIFFFDVVIVTIFGVIGVQYFRGTFYFCSDPTIRTEAECVGYFFSYNYPKGLNLTVPGLSCPLAQPRVWDRHGLNFDNIGYAYLTLFTMLTAEGWQNVMYSGVNSHSPLDTKTPLASIMDHKREAAIYFILYMIIMTFILLQLFVGFVIVTFQEDGVKTFRKAKLDRNQRNCLYIALTSRPRHQYIPKYKVHQKCRDKLLPILESIPVKFIIVIVLLFNTVLLCAQVYRKGEDCPSGIIIYYINIACTVFFALEAIVKLLILTPPVYFHSVWNLFDFMVALGSVIEMIIHSPKHCMMDFECTHIASAFRVLRLLRFMPQVKRILWTVIRSLEIFPYVGYLLIIIIFIYTVIGMHIFGTIAIPSVDESEERGIHQYNNFANFGNALLVMIRVITGENWQDVMLSTTPGQPCDNSTGLVMKGMENSCGNGFAYVFYPTFYFITTIMILNLFVAIIMDNFEYIVRDKAEMGAYDLRTFVKLWGKLDPQANGKLKHEEVFQLMKKMNPPVGWGKFCPRIAAYKKMMRMNMPIVHEMEEVDEVRKEVKKVTFNATLFALVRTALDVDCQGCPDCKKRCNIALKEKLVILFPSISQERFDEVLAKENDETVANEYAALMVQAEWRNFVLRRRKIMDIYQGVEKRKLKVHREVPDIGPDLMLSRRVSTFEYDLEPPHLHPGHVENSSLGTDRSRMSASRSPRSPMPRSPFSPMPVKEPDGCEGLWNQPSPNSESNYRPMHFAMPVSTTRESESPDSDDDHSSLDDDVDSPLTTARSEGDDVSFASAYSYPARSSSLESLSHHVETTV